MTTNPQPVAKPHRRWLQFSVRTMLVVLTLLCLWLGNVAINAYRQRAAVQRIQDLGGWVLYDNDYDPPDYPRIKDDLWSWLPKDYAHTVLSVYLPNTPLKDNQIDVVTQLPHTVILDVSGTEISDAGLARVSASLKLRSISLRKTQVTNHGAWEFRRAWPNCQVFQ